MLTDTTPQRNVEVERDVPGVLRIPGWGEFPWLVAAFSTRQGGRSVVYSGGKWGEQNLGWTADDDAAVVAANREQFVEEVCGGGGTPLELVTMRQTHSHVVRKVVRGPNALRTAEGKAVLQADGLLTAEAGLLLGVQTADCVPVLIADTRRRAVAGFHAGWRGTVARIVERGIAAMSAEFGSSPEDLIAAIGPAIGPCCFEVGGEVRGQFEGEFRYGRELFSTTGEADEAGEKAHLDLWAANRHQLVDAGLRPEAITVMGECTACSRLADGRRRYFSHRAESGFTGRMLSVVGVRP